MDLFKGGYVLKHRYSNAYHPGACSLEFPSLGDSRFNIGGVSVAHGLDDDGGTSADDQTVTYMYFNCFQSFHIQCPRPAAGFVL